jgi:hypothetical protein
MGQVKAGCILHNDPACRSGAATAVIKTDAIIETYLPILFIAAPFLQKAANGILAVGEFANHNK